MDSYNPGEVVLLAFPFSSATGVKKRPALVLFDGGDEDVLVARITGQGVRSTHDVVVIDWRGAGLRIPSVVRIDKLATLEKRLVERRLGRLMPPDWEPVRQRIVNFWAALPR